MNSSNDIAAPHTAKPAPKGASRLRNMASNQGLLVVLLVLVVAFSLVLPESSLVSLRCPLAVQPALLACQFDPLAMRRGALARWRRCLAMLA